MPQILRTKTGLATLAGLTFLMLQAPALAAEVSGLYFGANGGRSRNDYDTAIADRDLQRAADNAQDGLEITARAVRRLSTVWWADAGYYLNANVALEAAFLHLGAVHYGSSGTLTLNEVGQPISTAQEITSHGPALSVLGRLPVTEWFEFHAQLGAYFGKTILNQTIDSGTFHSTAHATKTNASLLGGAGMSFNFAGHWSLRTDFMHVHKTGGGDIGKFSVDMATAGVSFTF